MKIRMGIIGCGSVTKWAHLPAIYDEDLQDLIRVVAVCDIKKKNLNQVAERYNITQRYTDYNDLLRDKNIDAIDITAGHKANYEIIPEALKAGKHIFVEKPMTGTLSEAKKIAGIVNKSKIKFQVGFMKRFYFANRMAKELIEKGVLGEIEAVNGRFWIGAMNDLLNNGIHIFDLVQYFAGPVTFVYALSNEREKEMAGSITISMRFKNRAIGSLFLSSTPIWNTVHERIEVVGKNGKVLVSENGRRLYLYSPDQPTQYWEPPQVLHWVTGISIAGFAEEFKSFARSIIENSPTKVGVESGLCSIRLKEGVERSIEEKRSVDFKLL